MKLKVKFGLILLAGLTLVWAHQPITQNPIKMPTDLVIVAKKASWSEKRENKRIAKAYAQAGWGWRGREWLCLHDLWTRESRFDHLAQNPKSSAFGIPQLIGLKDKRPRIQILRGLRYIEHRYGTPCRAKAFWDKNKHY
ncbi:MAG: hypothetical protein ACO3QZ_06260 [Candidatus Nanopelagicaceae bacterium]